MSLAIMRSISELLCSESLDKISAVQIMLATHSKAMGSPTAALKKRAVRGDTCLRVWTISALANCRHLEFDICRQNQAITFHSIVFA